MYSIPGRLWGAYDVVSAVAAETGQTLWENKDGAAFRSSSAELSSGPRAMPQVVGERVVTTDSALRNRVQRSLGTFSVFEAASDAEAIKTLRLVDIDLVLRESAGPSGALSTFVAFLICGSVPLLPFAVGTGDRSGLSMAATALVFFGIGSLKSRWSPTCWWRSGLETLAVGLAAAGLAFGTGYLLRGLL